MKIFSITIVQNQEDIIESCIRHHQPIFDDLFIWDIGSTDSTVEVLNRLNNEFQNIHLKFITRNFSDDLRGEYYHEIRNNYSEDDWYYQLDSDEFLYSDIRKIIKNNKKSGYLRSWHYNFRFTDIDKSNNTKSYQELNYFKMDYSEIRAFKNSVLNDWPINDYRTLPLGNILPINLTKIFNPCYSHIHIHHFPNRSIEQIRNRILEKRKLVSGTTYKEVKGINYDKYKVTDIDYFIHNHKLSKDIRFDRVRIWDKIKVKFKTIWYPTLVHYFNRLR